MFRWIKASFWSTIAGLLVSCLGRHFVADDKPATLLEHTPYFLEILGDVRPEIDGTSGRTGIVGAIEASCPRTARSPACPRPAPARHPRTPASRAVSRPSTVMRRLISLRQVPVARRVS